MAQEQIPVVAQGTIVPLEGNLSSVVDVGNIHAQFGARHPEVGMAENIAAAESVTGDGKPLVVTSADYHNALASDVNPVPEDIAAKYIPRAFLAYFANGVQRTYYRQLIDPLPEPEMLKPGSHDGLLRNDGSKKPAYNAMLRLLDLLRDDTAAPAVSLGFELSGNTTGLESLLLHKSDGSHWLALWLAVSSYDRDSKQPLSVTPRPIRVVLAAPASVRAYEPIRSAQEQQSWANVSELQVQVSDEVLLLEIR